MLSLPRQGVLQQRPSGKPGPDFAGLFGFMQGLFASASAAWGAWWDVNYPGGARQPDGSPAINQDELVARLVNLAPGSEVSDVVFNAGAYPEVDYTMVYNDGITRPDIPLVRLVVRDIASLGNLSMNNVPSVALPAQYISTQGACLVVVMVMSLMDLLASAKAEGMDMTGVDLTAEVGEFATIPMLAGPPVVMVMNLRPNEAPGLYFNGVTDGINALLVGDIGAVQITGNDYSPVLADFVSTIGMFYAMPCSSMSRLALIPRALTDAEIQELSLRWLATMEVPHV